MPHGSCGSSWLVDLYQPWFSLDGFLCSNRLSVRKSNRRPADNQTLRKTELGKKAYSRKQPRGWNINMAENGKLSVYHCTCKERKPIMGPKQAMVCELMWRVKGSGFWMRWQCPGSKGEGNTNSQDLNMDHSSCPSPSDLYPGHCATRLEVSYGEDGQEKLWDTLLGVRLLFAGLVFLVSSRYAGKLSSG